MRSLPSMNVSRIHKLLKQSAFSPAKFVCKEQTFVAKRSQTFLIGQIDIAESFSLRDADLIN